MRGLGHKISVLDEEALVYFSPASYHSHRVAECAMANIDEFFAWGPDNVRLIETAPGYRGQPIRVPGNPRMDLLRPELRGYFEPQVREYQERFGNFILINSNFGTVNHYFPKLSRVTATGVKLSKYIQPESFMAEAFGFRAQIMEAFIAMLPRLADAFPTTPIVIRPHPAENHDTWRRAANGRANVHVIHEGNVYGWLLASSVKIHNGCTTAVESFLLDKPSVAYLPHRSEFYELGLPNSLSLSADSDDALLETVEDLLEHPERAAATRQQNEIASNYFAALDGPLAADRTADELIRLRVEGAGRTKPGLPVRLVARASATVREVEKRINERRPNHKNSRDYTRHRFPGIAVEAVNEQIADYSRMLGRFETLRARAIGSNLFVVEKA
jgi:surface carbohydrate biosynthesis protein